MSPVFEQWLRSQIKPDMSSDSAHHEVDLVSLSFGLSNGQIEVVIVPTSWSCSED